MSNGTVARLPEASVPEGVSVPGGPFVMVLLPHNRYLLGRPAAGVDDRWVWGKPGENPQDVFLYDSERLSLPQGETTSTTLSAEMVTFLKRELLAQMEPPGDHLSTVLILRGFMRDHAAFLDDFPFQDESAFIHCINEDDVLRKAYWTLRFALSRGEFDVVTRLKAWLKAGPELFNDPDNGMKIWFSILDLPDDTALQELEALAFSREDLRHMANQRVVPLLLFNPRSGYLVLSRFGKNGENSYLVWAFLPPALWAELRERRKLSIRDVLLALWGQYDIEHAMEERSRYTRGLGDAVSLSEA